MSNPRKSEIGSARWMAGWHVCVEENSESFDIFVIRNADEDYICEIPCCNYDAKEIADRITYIGEWY